MSEQHPYIKILFSQETEDGDVISENIWTTKVGEYYRIENIPFRTRDIALHDIVKVEEVEGMKKATEIVEESGHSTVRIYFTSDKLNTVSQFIESQGCRIEKANDEFIGIDIPPKIEYKPIKEYLEEGEQKGFWEYEEGCLAHEL
ncbi:MAG: DUF4265 domain-containing protein [Chitinophagales bacterium]